MEFQPAPPCTQTFRCDGCGYTWGPVGVEPFVPDAAEHQLFLYCAACRTPQVRKAATPVGLSCASCGAEGLTGLRACPNCGGAARWI